MLLRQKVTATSDSMGNISFTFLTVPVNQAWTGSFAIPTAPASAAFVLNLETGEHGGWGGPTPWGPLRLSPSEVATITGSGLQPNTGYTAVLIGDQAGSAVIAGPYPAPQTGQNPIIPSSDEIANVGTVSVGPTVSTTTILASPNGYETILVDIVPTTSNTSATVGVQVQNITTGVTSAWQSLLVAFGSSALTGPLFFPLPVRVNDTVEVHYGTLDGTTTPMDVRIVGLGAPIQPSLLRPDGRLMPVGGLAAFSSSKSTGATVPLVTPGASVSVLVSGAQAAFDFPLPTTSPWYANVYGTVKGTVYNLAGIFGLNPVSGLPLIQTPTTLIPPQGILCDAGTAVELQVASDGTSVAVGELLYDLVV